MLEPKILFSTFPAIPPKCYCMLCFWLLKNVIPSHCITLQVTRHSQEYEK